MYKLAKGAKTKWGECFPVTVNRIIGDQVIDDSTVKYDHIEAPR